jgi:chromosome segregation ATPase
VLDYLHNFQIQLAEERRERLLAEERSKQTSIELADAIKRLDRQQETAAANEKALEKRIKQLKVTADNLMEHLKRAEERVKQAEREADEYRQKANQLELSLAEAQKPSQRSTHAGVDDNTPVEVSESTSMIGTRQNSNASESVLDTRIERER